MSLHARGHIPLADIVSYADWGRFYAVEPCVDDRQGIGDVKEQVGEFISQYFLNPEVCLFPFSYVECPSPLFEELIHFRIIEADEVKLLFFCLT